MLLRRTLKRFCLNSSVMLKKCSEESNPNYDETSVTLYLRVSIYPYFYACIFLSNITN